jgi:hypothetical protein
MKHNPGMRKWFAAAALLAIACSPPYRFATMATTAASTATTKHEASPTYVPPERPDR